VAATEVGRQVTQRHPAVLLGQPLQPTLVVVAAVVVQTTVETAVP
jgi:hypothetical protein